MRGLVLLAALIASPAAAQDIMSGGINQSWTSSQLLLNSEKKAWAAPECMDPARWSTACPNPRPTPKTRERQLVVPSTPATSAVDQAGLRFRPSAEQRKRNFEQMLAKSRASDPITAALVKEITKVDVIGLVGEQMAPLGLRTDDVADALTVYVNDSWEVANDQVMPPDRARIQALRKQMAQAIATTPALSRTTDEGKQELAESMLVYGSMFTSAFQQAKAAGYKTLSTSLSDAAHSDALETLGIDLRKYAMTETGLRAR
jgi:hypothetical protein